MYPIELNASLTNYSAFYSRKTHPRFREMAKKVWERDVYCCQFCGFQAREFQEVVNLDQNYQNNQFDNLVTACCFCTQCFFLESVGDGGYGGGTLIYVEELKQAEINSLCHVLFCAMINNTIYKESAQALYRSLRLRSNCIETHLGENMSQPAVFGQMLVDYSASHTVKKPIKILKNLRVLPTRGRFKKRIEHWAKAAQKEMQH
jgi:intracellular multiplication protein IcmJ